MRLVRGVRIVSFLFAQLSLANRFLGRRLLSAALISVFAQSSGLAHADLVYNLVSYPASQNGYQLTGTITTNGTLGTLDYGTISASYKVSDGLNTYETVGCGAYGVTNLIATPTQLLLPANTSMTNPSLALTGMGFGTPQLTYVYRDWGGAFSAEHTCVVDSLERLNVLWDNAPATTLDGQPWVIATRAPEPASIIMLGIGAVSVMLCRTRNAREALKRGRLSR